MKTKVFTTNNATTKELKGVTTDAATNTHVKITLTNTKLLTNYIYLDTDERRKFAQSNHEYLIEQVQFTGSENKSKILLTYNHPVKALFWNIYNINSANSTDNIKDNNIKLILNGHDRFSEQQYDYFHLIQPYETNLGNDFTMHNQNREWTFGYNRSDLYYNIGLYSFCLNPDQHQPSGTCNFSRIDSAELHFSNFDTVNHSIYIFAVNYNILNITGGQGGLVYSN